MKSFVILVLAFAACANGEDIASRIVGGTDAPEGAYPYQVSLQQFGQHFCGGSIINSRWILSAAHCLTPSKRLFPSTVEVVVGATKLSVGGVASYTAQKVVNHPSWNLALIRNDIGLIKVTEDIVFSDKVQPVVLPTEDFTKTNYPAVLSGWGADGYPGVGFDHLQHITLNVIDQQICLQKSIRTTNANICTLTVPGEGACHGDSGGPLVADGVQIGVVSWGNPCALGDPDVFARVWSFLPWINSYVN